MSLGLMENILVGVIVLIAQMRENAMNVLKDLVKSETVMVHQRECVELVQQTVMNAMVIIKFVMNAIWDMDSKYKIQNCEIFDNDLAICTGCLDGFYSESVGGVITKCSPCLSNCERCDNSSTCRRSNNGYYVKDAKCSPCPENCESCSSDTYCEYCNKGYKLSNGKCIKNTNHCEDVQSGECVRCSKGYGPIFENDKKTDKCGPCPANCFDCGENKDYCIYCKDNYCYDENPTSSTYRQCIACNNNDDNVECLVEGCIACKPGKSDQCEQCNSTLELDQNFKCVKSISTLASPTPKPFEGSISYDAVDDNGKITYDFDEQNKDGDANQPIVLRLDRDKNDGYNIISNFTIQNEKNRKIAIEVKGYNELTLAVDPNTENKEFDIIIADQTSITINLESDTFASIKNGQGKIELQSTDDKDVNLNQVQPSSSLTITPNSQVVIKEVEFSGKNGEIVINSDNNQKVKVTNLKVQQGGKGTIKNASIIGTVVLALSSSLDINENVDLTSSTVDFGYSDSYSQLQKDGGQIQGKIASVPKRLIINYRQIDKWLSDERLLLADSITEFDCDGWGDIIEYNGPYNNHQCIPESDRYRLYAINKEDGGKGGNRLSPGVIAAIVIVIVVVVGAVIFVLVYFLVIKKRKTQSSGNEDEENDDKDANEV
ncbi:hypothetical protein M9Y10_021402 [Tritrichomonas musculus]|uniref:TNFR-Cys domain-containing protein n=1 Tax=Tritrichomonas musculus TaxID=1915356 RepID=A0ABR2HDW3_9EUKA